MTAFLALALFGALLAWLVFLTVLVELVRLVGAERLTRWLRLPRVEDDEL